MQDFLEVQAGFEPADNGVADRGLTTWLLHHTFKYSDIISKFFWFVKGSFQYFSIKFGKKESFRVALSKVYRFMCEYSGGFNMATP